MGTNTPGSKKRSPLRLTIALLIVAGLLLLIWLQFTGRLSMYAHFRDGQLLDKTAAEIVQVNGPPVLDSRKDADPPDGNDSFKLFYISGFQNIVIRFEHGKVVEIIRSEK